MTRYLLLLLSLFVLAGCGRIPDPPFLPYSKISEELRALAHYHSYGEKHSSEYARRQHVLISEQGMVYLYIRESKSSGRSLDIQAIRELGFVESVYSGDGTAKPLQGWLPIDQIPKLEQVAGLSTAYILKHYNFGF